MGNCYCGSGVTYSNCCKPIIGGVQSAETAEQLMRARYSAYVGAKMDFIFETTHPDHRQGYDHAGQRNGPKAPSGMDWRLSMPLKAALMTPQARSNSSPGSVKKVFRASITRMLNSKRITGDGISPRVPW